MLRVDAEVHGDLHEDVAPRGCLGLEGALDLELVKEHGGGPALREEVGAQAAGLECGLPTSTPQHFCTETETPHTSIILKLPVWTEHAVVRR